MIRVISLLFLGLAGLQAADCIAHRGDSIRHPDNSLAAIRAAWKAGADVVELDVRMLKDGTLVLFHDAHHRKVCIREFDYAAFNKRLGGSGVPTLEQGLQEGVSGKTLLLDLKEDLPEFLDRILAVLRESTISGSRVELQSASLKALEYLRQKAPVNTSLYYVTDLNPRGKWAEAKPLARRLKQMDVQGITAKAHQMVDEAYVKAFHDQGLKYYVWTINDPERMKHHVALGVNGVITDDPAAFRKIVPAKMPVKKLPLQGDVFEVAGCTAFLISPTNKVVKGNPWVWYAPTLPRLPAKEEVWMFKQWLDQGIAVAGIDVGESYGSPEGRKMYQALHQELVGKRGMGEKPCLLARSRGGLMLYSWAAENPEKVSGIAGIYPVCNVLSYPGLSKASAAYGCSVQQLEEKLADHNPVERLASLAKAGVPIFHLHGDRDKVVPLEQNSGLVKERYSKLGGNMHLELIAGGGHDMKTHWFESQKLVDFVSLHATGGLAIDHVEGLRDRILQYIEEDSTWIIPQ